MLSPGTWFVFSYSSFYEYRFKLDEVLLSLSDFYM